MILVKFLKKIISLFYKSRFNIETGRNWKMFSSKEYSNDLISRMIKSDKPFMISRIGSTEMTCISNYVGVKSKKGVREYLKGNSFPFWWNQSIMNQMGNWSGFFPVTIKNLEKFSELMLEDIPNIDLLGSWLNEEKQYLHLMPNTKQVVLEDLEPFFCENPWTRVLQGLKVLVVHPFAEAIELQYINRNNLFENELLPEFELQTLRAVQSLGGKSDEFSDWFQALDFMKSEIDKRTFDICIIGCGAYGLPLAAHVKRSGKKAIHLGGVTQLLFGIKGKRWENHIVWPYMNLFNEHWIRPGDNLKPENADNVEGACYW